MAIPDLPTFYDMTYVKEDKHLSANGYLYNDQLYQSLNALLFLINGLTSTDTVNKSPLIKGLNPPSKTTAEIAILFADTTVAVGSMWYDSDVDKIKFKGASAVQTITSV